MARTSIPGVAVLVERQMARWGAEREMLASAPPAEQQPSLAFSRQPSAGGGAVAARVGELLDYGSFDQQLVGAIAQERGVQRSLIAGMDEHLQSAIDRYVAGVLSRRSAGEDDYFESVVRIVSTLGQRGRVVVVGRGAPFILSPDQTLRVLVVAPTTVRIANRATRDGISEDEARRRVEADDRKRDEFVRFHFDVDQLDPTRFDLVVNTEHLDTDAAARVVCEAFRRRFPMAA